ncbi:Aldehyde/histidinol dehydrogenase [Radiomyces spectabilis]|uniref:Aldehyde/histidinol dehydrogenase n=1 Tax=Radiomyces spectabilis TaxID=64574 RepID=UPI00221EE1CB|nr:Aldehyde/histidinol dehydrogenase [Radiomyces spectabilis]KAI8393880.1 Aldehyde/histidinol dehydrogenase [Radiomyces spectabilis]
MSQLTYTPTSSIPSIVDDLRQTFRSGLTKNIAYRKEQLSNLVRLMKENTDALEKAIWDDLHKHEMECSVGEISPIIDECEYMIKNLDRFSKATPTTKRFLMNSGDKTIVRKEPKGVVLVIGAWNYPVNLLLMPAVGAIAAGNCVLFKPSEVSAHTAELISRLLPKYLDKRAYAVVNGGADETTVVLEQKFDHIFYTGNGYVGKIVMAAAAKHLTPVTLELGGKSPVIITPDANLEVAANRVIWGKCFNNGQTCVAPDYVLVPQDMFEPLIAAFRKSLVKFYTDTPQKSNSYGRIVSARHFDRLKTLIDKCDPKTILIGGETDKDDLFIAPTIVGPLTTDDEVLMQQEIFGPILPIIPVKDMNEAIEIVNSRDHPLAMYVFSENSKTYNHILDNTNSGGVVINDILMHLQELSLPFGGVGGSGMGNYHGDRSFDTFTHERSTMIRSTGMETVLSARYPPYTDDKNTLLSLLVYGFPSSAGAKVKTFFTVCSAAWNVFFKKSKL